MKRSLPKRDWTEARAKVEREGVCRLARAGDCGGKLEAAHVIGRHADMDPDGFKWKVLTDRIIPLCQAHHRAYDAHQVDVLHVLDLGEQVAAVKDAGSVETMRRRTAPTAYREAA